jgi:hypothetical protein
VVPRSGKGPRARRNLGTTAPADPFPEASGPTA